MPHDIEVDDVEEFDEYDDEPYVERGLGILLLVAGLVGFAAAFVLVLEKLELLKDPDYIPSCSLNPVLSCGSVMQTGQAEVFGFPNPLIGVAAFAAAMMLGLALLAGGRFAPWLWAAAQGAVTLGILFVHWLIIESIYVIGALCPYCMVVWVVVALIFGAVTLRNLQANDTSDSGVIAALVRFRWLIFAAWCLIIIVLIGIKFWYYWSTLL